MNYLDFSIREDANPTIEEAEDHLDFVGDVNYLVDEGMVELEYSNDGEVRAYPING